MVNNELVIFLGIFEVFFVDFVGFCMGFNEVMF